MTSLIAVHCGAGVHKEKNFAIYNRLCRRACRGAMKILEAGGSALDAVKTAVMILEDDPQTNAGIGSNLTQSGSVETDAAIMDGKSLLYGGCGAVQRVKNPVALAYHICIKQMEPLGPMGLIPPNFLVGNGALKQAKEAKLTILTNKQMRTVRTTRQFKRFRQMMAEVEEQERLKKQLAALEEARNRPASPSRRRSASPKRKSDKTAAMKNVQYKVMLDTDESEAFDFFDTDTIMPDFPNRMVDPQNSTTSSITNPNSSTFPNFPITNSFPSQSSYLSNAPFEIQSRPPSAYDPNVMQPAPNFTLANVNLMRQENIRMDTVGAVCIDKDGRVAAAASSGGLIMKKPGRVGQAALYASGVWADSSNPDETAVAICTSGCGEHLVQTHLAKEIGDDLKDCACPATELADTITEKFLKSRFLRNVDEKLAGALVIHKNSRGEGTVLWAHSTQSMSVGYLRSTDLKATAMVSQLPQNVEPGTTVAVGGADFR